MSSTFFVRVIGVEDKAPALRDAIRNRSNARRYSVDTVQFRALPKTPFAYWVGDAIRRAFSNLSAFAATSENVARVGLQTNDDFQWIRHSWEVAPDRDGETRGRPYAKGGPFARHYSDLYLMVVWGSDGRLMKAWKDAQLSAGLITANNSKCWNESHYGRPGITWSSRTKALSFRVLPTGAVFGNKGPGAFVALDRDRALLAHLGVFNSRAFQALVDAQTATTELAQSFDVGIVERTPVPDLTPADEVALASLARRAWSLKRSLDTRTETSHAFVLPALLQTEGRTLAARSAAWTERVQATDAELADIQAEIDDRCFVLYGISDEDRRAITEGFGGSGVDAEASDEEADTADEAEADAAADTATLAAELVSWAAGVAFGRFDVRLATGERAQPVEPEPFDPLPVCSPAMLSGADGLPLAAPPAGYPLTFPTDGTLVDDPGHARDLTAVVRVVFDVVFGASADAISQEASALLDPKGHDLRTWLAKDFFAHHLARHSKSRRKAPILWQLGTPSGRYSAWLYAHRLTRDSLFALARDIVGPKLALEERRHASLVTDAGANPTAKQRAELETQAELVAELRTFDQEVRRVAPLWNPDLDDGIVLVEAPLWRLVPHKPWAKELKSRWDDLVAGKYDWAHLAMHLWPDRVVPKCASDRSLAIAHGLEEVFWVEGTDNKWTKRARPTRTIEDLVNERTSPAVKAALADLLAAPTPAAVGRGRGRG